jgi:thiol-disulfide isomerase/thioredoxin
MRQNLIIVVVVLLTVAAVDRLWSSPDPTSEWIGKKAPWLAEGDWINSTPLSLKDLRGKVVLLEFWTYGCSNCLNTLPHIKEWNRKYSGAGFQVIGVHTPEFDREKDVNSVRREVARHGITYPVVTDNDYTTWNRYNQRYWPVTYLLDKNGVIHYVHIGEGNYDETENHIASLIAGK